MLPDRVSNPGPLTYESGALPIALRGPASENWYNKNSTSRYLDDLLNIDNDFFDSMVKSIYLSEFQLR